MYERILVPLDGSRDAEASIAPAAEIAAKFGGRVVLLHVAEPSADLSPDLTPWTSPERAVREFTPGQAVQQETRRTEVGGYLAGLLERLEKQEIGAEVQCREGDPVPEILKFADEDEISLIVITSHGRGGLTRLVFGSVADKLLQHSTVPVLVIRPDAVRHTPRRDFVSQG